MRKGSVLLAVSVAGVALLMVGLHIDATRAAETNTAVWMFQGRVYEGNLGEEPPHSQPLEGVLVSGYGGNNPYPNPGSFITSTNTNSEGWYGLTVSDGYEYYHIVETDPSEYHSSVGATTVSGTVQTSNWIQYDTTGQPLSEQTLTGNKFWDTRWETRFEDDFEDGVADGWNLDEGWGIAEIGGRQVLCGSGHRWAVPVVAGWVDYELTTTVKLLTGTVHINVRYLREMMNETDMIQRRYYVGLKEDRLYIKKQIGNEFFDLVAGDIPFSLGGWHTVRVRVEGTSILVYVNDELLANFTDDESPIMFGGFSLETLDASEVCLDDIRVVGPFFSIAPGYVWTRTGGPSGGLGYDVRIHPLTKTVMFVTDNPSGVNKSYDGGTTWVQRNISITTRTGPSSDEIPIFSLTIDPNDPRIVWAGTQNKKGIYKSVDGGGTWDKRDNGVIEGDEISFRGFGVHPHDPDVVFGGAEVKTGIVGKAFDKTKGVIYRTLDGGLNWTPVWSGDNLVRFILFDYNDTGVLYASTGIFDREGWDDSPTRGYGTGVLKSENGGDDWFEINNGIPDEDGNRFVGFLEMHPGDPQILFAASGNNTWGSGGVYRTFNGGLNWTKVLSDDIFTLVTFSPSSPNVVYAGSAKAIYRSDDGGDTWEKLWKPSEGLWGPPGIRAGVPIGGVVDPNHPMTIFVNNYQGGNFRSTDGGETWTDASKGYTGAKLTGIAINPVLPAMVYAVGRSGPFRSRDAGANWAGLAYSPAIYPEWYDVALNPSNPQEMLIADEHEGIILKSTDGGGTWRIVFDHPVAGWGSGCTTGPRDCHDGFRSIVYAPISPSIVYAGMSAERRTIGGFFSPARASYGMYKSVNGGESWAPISTGLPTATTALLNIHDVAVDPTDPNIAYAGTWKNGLYKTTNGGLSWVAKNNGLTSLDVRSVAVDPKNPQIVYAGLGEGAGIYRSTNGGGQWKVANTGLKIVCPSYLLPIGRGVEGISFEGPPSMPLNVSYSSSMPWTSIWDIIIDPTDSQVVYAADHHSGVHISVNSGSTWRPINDGLTMRAVTQLDIASDGQVIYAATWGGGVFRLGEVEIHTTNLPLVLRDF